MRICYLAAADSIHSLRWIRFFADQGHTVLWISLSPALPEVQLLPNITYFECTHGAITSMNGAEKLVMSVKNMKKIKKLVQEFNPDIVHAHSCGTYGLIAALLKRHPLIMTPWGSDILLSSPIKKILTRWIIKKADHFTVDGDNTQLALKNFGVDGDKISMIRFGTHVEQFDPDRTHELSLSLREKLAGCHSNSPKIISLRSHEPIYDIATLIKAGQLLKKKKIGFELIIGGDGSQRKELESLAISLGIGQHTHFIGKVAGSDLPALYQAVDVAVSTSLSDSGLAASTAEAMASGLPVVVSDSSDNASWVPKEGGSLFTCANPDALAEKLAEVISMSTEKRKKMGSANRKVIVEHNNYTREMQKTEALYQSLIHDTIAADV